MHGADHCPLSKSGHYVRRDRRNDNQPPKGGLRFPARCARVPHGEAGRWEAARRRWPESGVGVAASETRPLAVGAGLGRCSLGGQRWHDQRRGGRTALRSGGLEHHHRLHQLLRLALQALGGGRTLALLGLMTRSGLTSAEIFSCAAAALEAPGTVASALAPGYERHVSTLWQWVDGRSVAAPVWRGLGRNCALECELDHGRCQIQAAAITPGGGGDG